MILQLADPINYVLNGYAIPMLAAGVAITSLGFFVLFRERGSRVGTSFHFLCLSVGLFLISFGFNYASTNASVSLFWIRISHLGVVFIPSSVLLLTLVLCGLFHRYSLAIAASIGLSLLFGLSIFLSDLFIRKIERFFWGHYPHYGPLGFVFLAFFLIIMAFILFLYWREYRGSATERSKQRTRGLLIAFSGGYLGSVDFLPAMGISVYPFGYIPIFFFIFVCTYVVIRYQLVDITPELAAGEILETMQGAVIVSDLEGRIQVINREALEMLGYQKSEILGRSLANILPIPAEMSAAVQAGERSFNRGMVWPGRKGKQYDVIISASPLTDHMNIPLGTVYVAHDITERKQAEDALQESEEKYRSLVESAQDPIFTSDEDGRYLYVNSAAAARFGTSPEKIIGKSVHDLFPHHIAERYLSTIRKVIKRGEGIVAEDRSEINGRPFWFSTNLQPIRDREGNVKAVQAVARDISNIKQAEEALRESEQRLRAAINVSQIGIFDHDQRTDTIYWSQQQRIIHGWGTDEPITLQAFLNLIHPEDREMITAAVRRAHDPSGDGIWDVEHRIIRRDGTVRWLKERSQTFFEGEGDARRPVRTVGAVLDITELRRTEKEHERLQAQLFQAQKMESIGQLAGGIAHDFNNILAAIIGYGNLLQMKIPVNDPLRNNVDRLLESAERAAQLTHSLLTFSRKQVLKIKPTHLNGIIASQEQFLRRIIGEDIEIKSILHGDAVIMADSGQIEQVLMNLATNARDAMPKGGQLTVETDLLEITDVFIGAHGFGISGTYAVISVTDTGTGMDEEAKQKIFEPFFTTKEVGRGTGLGMAIVYGIVKQHKGYINVSSQVGKGTTFKIYLPVHSGPVQQQDKPISSPVMTGTETILLAEDDATLRTFFRNILTEHGYTVVVAENGEEAIRKFFDRRDEIHLCVLDMIMPKKSGREVFEAIQKMKPGTKVIFSSGYTADKVQREGLPAGSEFIAKPAPPQAFLNKIREVLDDSMTR